MKNHKNFIGRQIAYGTAMMAAWVCLTAGAIAHAQTANLSPDLQDILRFSQAHMTDDVILAYIKNSGKNYNITADQMLYLNGQGVSQPVLSALLQAKSANPPPAAPVPAPSTPAPAPVPEPAPTPVPAPGLADFFNAEGGLNPAYWTAQGNALSTLAAIERSTPIMPTLFFGPAGMQMSGVSAPGQLAGIQSITPYAAPFTLTAKVTGLAEVAIPFEVYLVSPDSQQWFSLAGHLGGAGHREGELRVGGVVPFARGSVDIPLGHEPSPQHGIWANSTGSGLPLSMMGNKISERAAAGLPYVIQMTVGPDGMGSVAVMDTAGETLGERSGMPVGMGPFYVVLAERNGPTLANWQSVELTPLAPPPPVAAPPEVPTFGYFQAQLSPYGRWIDAPDIGACWVPAEGAYPGWRPYMNSGHWEYTDAGWYWRSDYPWGEIAFHYGRWINDARTGFVWAWAPQYDWAPSWVCWRYATADGCMGWAPLPWEARYRVGVGIEWHGGVAVDVGFGLGADAFVFVGRDHFYEHDYTVVVIDRERSRRFYEHSEVHNGYREDHGKFVADGWGREHVATFTHHEVAVRPAHEMRVAEEHHNYQVRTEQHPALAARAEQRARSETTGQRQQAGAFGQRHPPGTTEQGPRLGAGPNQQPYPEAPNAKRPASPKPKPGQNERKPGEEKKPQPDQQKP